MDRIERVQNKLNTIPYDLKAEVILSSIVDLLKKNNYDFLVNHKSQFKRSYSKDVLGVEIVDYEYDSTQILSVDLSRDGIYDTLPEGVFHYPKHTKTNQSVDDMTSEYREQKEEEVFARKFFTPFENEFFLVGLKKEQEECDILLELNGSKPLDFYYRFWDLEKDLPKSLTAKLIRILPYAYRIVGNLDLTAKCLRYIIDENVEIVELGYKETTDSEQSINLGDCRLGLDMISGSTYTDYSLYLEFKIGPLENSYFMEYIHNGGYERLIHKFYEYFLPMEIDVKTTILLPQQIETFSFEDEKQPILGITTRI
ncbi:MAG: type VI secretion system baseplate subunit TssG [Moheibacter sp.]